MAYSMFIIDSNTKNSFRTKEQYDRYINMLEEDRLKYEGTCLKDIPWLDD